MTPIELAVIFVLIAVVLFVADIFVPSHGTLTILGAVALLGAVACGFAVSARAGFVALAVMIIASPFAIMAGLKVWPRTPVGRRMTLSDVASESATSPAPVTQGLRPGDRGVAVTALRPIGVCELRGERVEATSDRGVIAPGTEVLVISIHQQRPVVRAVEVPVAPEPAKDAPPATTA